MKLSVLTNWMLGVSMLLLIACQPATKDEYITELNNDWYIQSADKVSQNGADLSKPSFDAKGWIKGDIPATVMTILMESGEYPNLFMGDNIDQVDDERFKQPWWYKKTFLINELNDKSVYQLRFEGLNYKANIWVNGTQVGQVATVEGPFSRWTFNVSDYLMQGNNSVAVEIIPPVRGDLTIGFVDWNPAAPDQNMGLWRGVELIQSQAISIESPFVSTKLNRSNWKDAELTVTSQLTNHSDKKQNVTLNIDIKGIGSVAHKVSIAAGESRDVVVDASQYPVLNVKNAKLWWPNNLGDPNMYNITVSAVVNGSESQSIDSRFGIREIEEYLNDDGHKGWKVNGKPLTIKGAGWVDDMFLADSKDKVLAQVDYVKHMNLNCIRLEGFWGRDKTIYDAADENGLLVMIGWSCHWEWEAYCGRPETHYMAITGKDEIERHAQSYRDQVMYLRNHPSVFLWVFGSDKLPVPELEAKLNDYITSVDNSRPILAACKYQDFGTDVYNHSEVSGATGVKMLGPYGYVPPVYWYIDTIAGGAYGFNTETGPGPQVPPVESIKKMLPADKLWPINDMWNFHCGRHQFGSLDRYLNSFNKRYGEAADLEEFAFKSQISNYEAIRPMFEAFQSKKYHATGVIQWMLNSAWPEMFWQLYDYYLLPNGAFYGTKKACQPLSAVYNYKDNGIYWVNDYNEAKNGLSINVDVYDINSKVLFTKKVAVDMHAHSSGLAINLPEIEGLTKAYFVNLEVMDANNQLLADNFYWLSTKADKMKFEETTWVYTPAKEFADLKLLNSLPKVDVTANWSTKVVGDDTIIECELVNASNQIAFFIEAGVLNKETQQTIVPVFWDDNYVSLMPNETKTITARIATKLMPEQVDHKVKGWNVK
ncbi:sugar-binding domain-containing protein [Carboxylicivirga sp. M1479]|uniref:glycoside hydrolase family 2 protein n=1 Tax=Carboxylicivirga sp. M1479 TaxID=2594476 RepID=UPI001178032F|nr:sugar-binding domain-containing protein [Carboxylicivirga sp. M1479]TRX70961.1 glycoside hydrolase family 2 [Carboxylicivirga sp. M1479]